MSTIRFENVSKQFPNSARPAVDSVNLTAEEGSFVVLLGPSGCGKTTLLKMVNRLYEPTAGTIYLGDTDIRQIDATTLRRQIGYVIQQIGLFPHMTVAENIAVVPRLLQWEPPRIAARVDELLTLVDLPPAEYRGRYPSQLSGGQQQRVGVARALAGDPGVILMDEPFGAVDAITRTGLQDELLRLQRQLCKTILFVTHDVEEALRLADQIVIMREGQIVQHASPVELLAHPADQFVRDLTGADDVVRQLGLIRVETVMEPLPPGNEVNGRVPNHNATIPCNDNLRRALSVLLASGDATLTVLDDDKPVGVITLAAIRAVAGNGGVK